MKPTLLLTTLFIITFELPLSAKQNPNRNSEIQISPGKLNLSFFTGISIFGPSGDMEANMKSLGLDDTSGAGWFGGAKDHPFTERYPNFELNATYFLTKADGFSATGALINNIEVDGYQANEGIENYMILKSELWMFSFCYTHRLKEGKQSFFIGPAYFNHVIKDNSSVSNPAPTRNRKPGIFLGYSNQFLQKKHWFLAFKASFKWAPKSEVGQFAALNDFKIKNP